MPKTRPAHNWKSSIASGKSQFAASLNLQGQRQDHIGEELEPDTGQQDLIDALGNLKPSVSVDGAFPLLQKSHFPPAYR